MNNIDVTPIDAMIAAHGCGPEATIPLLQAIQNEYRYLPAEALEYLCAQTDITPAQVTSVSTFYSQFRHKPAGEHDVCVCVGTACHVKGATGVYDAFARHLNIADGDDTDSAGRFTLNKVACLGCCTLAPAVQIGDHVYGHVTPQSVGDVLDDYLLRLSDKSRKQVYAASDTAPEGEIRLGLGSCCQARGSGQLYAAAEAALAKTGRNVTIKSVGCVGICSQTPLLEIITADGKATTYTNVQPDDAEQLIWKHFAPKGMLRKLCACVSGALDNLLTDQTETTAVEHHQSDVRDGILEEFLSPQKHIATEHGGVLNPLDLDEYQQRGGIEALRNALQQRNGQSLLDALQQSGLRGRGGAGFPTARKWATVAAADSSDGKKYVVCNGDEGDPGAFMDRMLLESYPYRILEGMAIAAYVVGADEGILYIRAEYPLAVQRVREAMQRMTDAGLLGENILGSGFSLQLRIMEGAGAFVCGEETALLESIEGRRGMPRLRPPYPAESGLWQRPTLVNNVETYCNISWILRFGGEQFGRLGREQSHGTKVFALAGKVLRGGLIEVPMGMTVNEIVHGIGGGVAGGKAFKAVQIGGPSGGCIPARLGDTAIDYERLQQMGAMMGSGGLVVLDEDDCMVDIARYFLQFTQDQSCGKCTFCRIGTQRMLSILDSLCNGTAKPDALEQLEALADSIKRGSLCGLGKTAPNPVLTTLKYFRDEYEAHLQGRCPAGVCTSLITYSINDNCIGCSKCAQQCPVDAIAYTPYEKHQIDETKCVRCGACKTICPAGAIEIH